MYIEVTVWSTQVVEEKWRIPCDEDNAEYRMSRIKSDAFNLHDYDSRLVDSEFVEHLDCKFIEAEFTK